MTEEYNSAAVEQSLQKRLDRIADGRKNLVGNNHEEFKKYAGDIIVSRLLSTSSIEKTLKTLRDFCESKSINSVNDLLTNPAHLALAIQAAKKQIVKSNFKEALKVLTEIQSIIPKLHGLDVNKYGGDLAEKFAYIVNIADKIELFAGEYEGLTAYCREDGLDVDYASLPETVEEFYRIKGIKMLPSTNSLETKNTQLPSAGQKILADSKEAAQVSCKNVVTNLHDNTVNHETACTAIAIGARIEYEKCRQDTEKGSVDTKCNPLAEKADNIQANCQSHYPMVTITDKLTTNLYNNVKQSMLIVGSDGMSAQFDVQDYTAKINDFLNLTTTHNQLASGKESSFKYNGGTDDSAYSEISEQFMIAFETQLQLIPSPSTEPDALIVRCPEHSTTQEENGVLKCIGTTSVCFNATTGDNVDCPN